MNAVSRLYRAIKSPKLFARHANRLYHRRLNRRSYNPAGVDLFAEDWDSLVILDACRYDLFERHSTLPGLLESRESRGSSTTEFLLANVAGRDLSDTVYVTANPQLYRNREAIDPQFHRVVDVWRGDGWDEEHGTVLPETVTAYAERAAKEYPEKRLLVHYVQPHYPFVGSATDFGERHLEAAATDAEAPGENVWGQLMTGALDRSPGEVWEPYAANLERALPHVEELLDELGGRTVVTADHGNAFGERSFPVPIREWGHPRGTYIDELVRVPWLVYDNGPRREVVRGEAEESAGSDTVADETVADRLEHLGYTE